MTTEPKEKSPAPHTGTAIAKHSDTPTEAWLKGKKDVEISMTPSGLVMWLPDSLRSDCHMTVASTQITQTDPNYRWVPRLVMLNEAEHSYPEGKERALNKKGLQLLADASGIQFLEPLADHMGGTGVRYTARARRRNSDGTWDPRSDDKTVRFAHIERKARRERKASIEKFAADGKDWAKALLADPVALEDELLKYVDDQMEHLDAKTLTKAMNRVIRSWLSLKSTYQKGEIESKPFLCISWVLAPDYSNPLVRDIIALNHRRADNELYGPPAAAPAELLAPAPASCVTDEHGEVIEGHAIDAGPIETDAPPKPENIVTFKHGPYEGQKIDAVIEDEAGRRWIADTAAGLKQAKPRQLLIDWLSWAEKHPVAAEDLAAIAARSSADEDIPF